MIKTFILLGAAVLAASASAAPAAAQPEQGSVVVRVADLDTSRPGDAARLDLRLRNAARDVCGDADARNLSLSAQTAGCQAEAIARARTEVTLAMRSGGTRVIALRTN